MYKKVEFEKFPIRSYLVDLFADYEYPTDNDQETIEGAIEEIRGIIKKTGIFENEFRLNKNFCWDEDELTVEFTVSLTTESKLTIEKYRKKTFEIEWNTDFYDDFIIELAEFFDGYKHGLMLQDNVKEFNQIIQDVLLRNSGGIKNSKRLLSEGLYGPSLRGFYQEKNLEILSTQVMILDLLMDAFKKYQKQTGLKVSEMLELVSSQFIDELYDKGLLSQIKVAGQVSTFKTMELLVNAVLNSMDDIKTIEPVLNISFAYGDGDEHLLDVSENHAVIGLSEEVIKDLAMLPLFNPYTAEGYKERIMEAIKECQEEPYKLLTVDSTFTRDLGINHYPKNKEKHSIIKDSFKPLKPVGEGIGYYHEDEIFALVEKTSATNRDKPFKDKKGNDLKLKFKIEPYSTKNKPVKITLEDIWSEITK